MPKQGQPAGAYRLSPVGPYRRQLVIDLTAREWHAAVDTGAAVNVSSGFTQPSAANADRIPQVVAAAGGASFNSTIVGTWDGEAQTDTIACLTNATTKYPRAYDTITSWTTDVDPVSAVTLQAGDSFMSRATDALYVGGTGDIAVQLDGESSVKTIPGVAGGQDWLRRAVRVNITGTSATGLHACWL